MPDNAPSLDQLKQAVREYVLSEFLPGEDPDSLRDDTPMVTGGILDSITSVKLVTFLEDGHRSRPQSEIDMISDWILAGAKVRRSFRR